MGLQDSGPGREALCFPARLAEVCAPDVQEIGVALALCRIARLAVTSGIAWKTTDKRRTSY